jgi:hypothetical protein
MLVRVENWSNTGTGPELVERLSNSAQRCWSNTGQTLVEHWPNAGHKLIDTAGNCAGRGYWSNAYPAPVQRWLRF